MSGRGSGNRQDAGQDPLAQVGIQPHAGQVLEPQVAVGVDLGAPRPLLHQGRLPGVSGEQVDRLLSVPESHPVAGRLLLPESHPVGHGLVFPKPYLAE